MLSVVTCPFELSRGAANALMPSLERDDDYTAAEAAAVMPWANNGGPSKKGVDNGNDAFVTDIDTCSGSATRKPLTGISSCKSPLPSPFSPSSTAYHCLVR